MPFVHIRVAGKTLTATDRRYLQEEATGLMENIMTKKREVTAVLVEEIAADSWSIGAQAVPVAAHLEVAVTAGTNTDAQKSAFIREAAEMLRSRFAGLPTATYVVVRELSGDAWGYDGITQNGRKALAAAA